MRHILNEDAKLDSMRRAIVDNGFTDATVDAIIAMDSQSRNGGAGQVAKSLLLPKFIEGETDFINYARDVAAAINTYYANRGSYPNEAKNVGNFASVAQFIKFVADPSSVSFGGASGTQKSKIDQIYEKNYSAIPRDIFNDIISWDPLTTADAIGAVARTFYLPHALAYINTATRSSEIDFTNKEEVEKLKHAVEWFQNNASRSSDGLSALTDFKSTKELVDYVDQKEHSHCEQITNIFNFIHSEEGAEFARQLADMRGNSEDLGDDLPDFGLELLAETSNWMVWWPKSRLAGCMMANGGWDNAHGQIANWWRDCGLYHEGTIGMQWCTSSATSNSYFPSYSDSYSDDPDDYRRLIISFINKSASYPRNTNDRKRSLQVALSIRNSSNQFEVTNSRTFLAGNDDTPSYGQGSEGFKAFFAQNPELIDALKDKFPFTKCRELLELTKYRKEEIVINSWEDFSDVYHMQDIKSQAFIKKITIGPAIKRIPSGIFAGTSIASIRIPGNVKFIEPGAFLGCSSLTDLVIMEGVEDIGNGAFFGCSGLSGKVVLLPDSLNSIGRKAFGETACKIKIKASRLDDKKPISISRDDQEWFKNCVSVVNVK